jgi:hypothetical protein
MIFASICGDSFPFCDDLAFGFASRTPAPPPSSSTNSTPSLLLERVRRKLAGSDDGDRQMVKILAAVLTDGLPTVEAACVQALSEGVHSADMILNLLARQRDPGPAATIMTPTRCGSGTRRSPIAPDTMARRAARNPETRGKCRAIGPQFSSQKGVDFCGEGSVIVAVPR